MNTRPIALLTDFGTRDYYVGAMKGVVLSINPAAVIVDLTHDVPPQDIREAAFTLRACYRDFPIGTIFVAVVDPGVGSGRRAIVVESEGYYFVAPDNGLLSLFFGSECQAYDITEKRFFREAVSSTFHGRDIFAPVGAHLSLGVAPAEFGPEISDQIYLPDTLPRAIEGGIAGAVINIDRFGNIVTNITPADLPPEFTVSINGRVIEKRCRYYAEAAEGEIFSIVGSAGFLEISVRNGSAASELSLKAGDAVIVTSAG